MPLCTFCTAATKNLCEKLWLDHATQFYLNWSNIDHQQIFIKIPEISGFLAGKKITESGWQNTYSNRNIRKYGTIDLYSFYNTYSKCQTNKKKQKIIINNGKKMLERTSEVEKELVQHTLKLEALFTIYNTRKKLAFDIA